MKNWTTQVQISRKKMVYVVFKTNSDMYMTAMNRLKRKKKENN